MSPLQDHSPNFKPLPVQVAQFLSSVVVPVAAVAAVDVSFDFHGLDSDPFQYSAGRPTKSMRG